MNNFQNQLEKAVFSNTRQFQRSHTPDKMEVGKSQNIIPQSLICYRVQS